MKVILALFCLSGFTPWSLAFAEDNWYLRPNGSIGYNSQQGSFWSLGLDVGRPVGGGWNMGMTGHYGAGEQPTRDRQYGGGLFTSYAHLFSEGLVGHVREEIDYLDVRNPVDSSVTTDPDYVGETGVASVTSVSLATHLSDSVIFSIGYSFMLGITNSDLGRGRSGPIFGFLIGI